MDKTNRKQLFANFSKTQVMNIFLMGKISLRSEKMKNSMKLKET